MKLRQNRETEKVNFGSVKYKMQLPDIEQFSLVKGGNVGAYETLFKSYYQQLCSYACSFLNNIDEAEEVVQEIFINLWDKKESLVIETSVKSYLYRAASNACLNKIKHEKVKKMYKIEAGNINRQSESSAQRVVSKELEQEINTAINGLPEQCRVIFKLSRFEHMKYAEIAQELNLSVKTVENQVGKALRIMREKLVDYLPLLIICLTHLIYGRC